MTGAGRLVLAPVLRAAGRALGGLTVAAVAVFLLQGLGRTAVQPGVPATLRALVALLPAAVELTVPVALLAGGALAGARLAERAELVGLAACGIPARRLVPGLLLVGALAAVGYAGLLHELAPRGRAAARAALSGSLSDLRVRPGEPVVVGQDRVLLRVERTGSGGWEEVFVAAGALVATARQGSVDEGLLRLQQGELAPMPDLGWRLRFDEARVPLAPATPRVELEERSSPHLRALVLRMRANGRDASREALAWWKRWTMPLMLPMLLLSAFAAGARSQRPGAVVAGATVAWWVGLRLADKLVEPLGLAAAAGAPVLLVVGLAAGTWATWRLA